MTLTSLTALLTGLDRRQEPARPEMTLSGVAEPLRTGEIVTVTWPEGGSTRCKVVGVTVDGDNARYSVVREERKPRPPRPRDAVSRPHRGFIPRIIVR